MSERTDQEMRDLQATSVPVLEYRVPSGHERAGDVLVSAGSLLSWCAVWFYFRAARVERRRERELGQDLA